MWDFVSQKILKHRSYFVFSSNVLLGIIVCNSPYRGVYIMLSRTVIKNDSLSTLTIHHYPAVNLNSLHLIFFLSFSISFSPRYFSVFTKKKRCKFEVRSNWSCFRLRCNSPILGFSTCPDVGFRSNQIYSLSDRYFICLRWASALVQLWDHIIC